MKTHTLKFRAVNKDTFEAIESNKKKVETRAGTVKNTKIEVGDVLKFVCGKESFEKKVSNIKKYKNIKAILKDYEPKEINPKLKTEGETIDMYYSFPKYKEKIKKYGLIAFELK
ncbi:MAG: hypothetical protein AAB638_00585 [Patescibacteria group bacterium]